MQVRTNGGSTVQIGRKRKKRRGRRTVKRVLSVLLFLLVVEYLVVPQIAGARRALSLLKELNVIYVVLGVTLEFAAILAYAQLTRAMLPRESAPPVFTLARIQIITAGVSHIVPGGTATGATLGFRLLSEAGVRPADAGFAMAVQSIGSAVVLNLLLWGGLIVSIPLRGFNPLYGTAAIVGVILIGTFAGLVVLVIKGEQRAVRVVRAIARKLPFMNEHGAERAIRRIALRTRVLISDRGLLARAVGWATVNWLCDAASLWVFVAAYGHRVDIDGLVVAFGLANVLAAVPITPGGLGVVETVLASTLVAFGTPKDIALLGVISYRLVNFWLPIPVGAAAYLSLQFRRKGEVKDRAEQLRLDAGKSIAIAGHCDDWEPRNPGPVNTAPARNPRVSELVGVGVGQPHSYSRGGAGMSEHSPQAEQSEELGRKEREGQSEGAVNPEETSPEQWGEKEKPDGSQG